MLGQNNNHLLTLACAHGEPWFLRPKAYPFSAVGRAGAPMRVAGLLHLQASNPYLLTPGTVLFLLYHKMLSTGCSTLKEYDSLKWRNKHNAIEQTRNSTCNVMLFSSWELPNSVFHPCFTGMRIEFGATAWGGARARDGQGSKRLGSLLEMYMPVS